jgi:hypothetical protein
MPGFLLTKIAKSHPSKGKTNLCSETLTAPSTEALINLDTAKGVSVSPSILILADEVIEVCYHTTNTGTLPSARTCDV